MSSEQTFRVGVAVSDPGDVRPAAIQTSEGEIPWDYRIGGVGKTFILIDFPAVLHTVTLSLVLNADTVPEGLEGTLLTSSVVSDGFPTFMPPLPTSTTAFQSTTITIIDDDGKTMRVSLSLGSFVYPSVHHNTYRQYHLILLSVSSPKRNGVTVALA